MGIKSFEEIDAWRLARQVVGAIYLITRGQEMARDFGLCSQLQRAAVSIMSNLPEGFERIHLQEKLQFYNIARGSCAEERSLLRFAEDDYQGLAERSAELSEEVVRVGKMITGLFQSTQRRKNV